MKRKKVSQQTIADALGVTQALVSGVLSGKAIRIPEETRRTILGKAKSLGYKNNGQDLTNPNPNLILFITHTSAWSEYIPVIRGMKRALEGENTLITSVEWQGADTFDFDILDNVIGCISVSAELALDSKSTEMIRQKIPLVFMFTQESTQSCDNVTYSMENAIIEAILELRNNDHCKFGYFGLKQMGPLQSQVIGQYYAALAQQDLIPVNPEWFFTPSRKDSSIEDLRRCLHMYLANLRDMKEKPTAIFFEDETFADQFIQLASEYDFTCPRDFSVFAFSHIQSEYREPPFISTIKGNNESVGEVSIELVLRRKNRTTSPTVNSKVNMKWNPHGSVGPALQASVAL